jgi:hypothetical protein
MTIVIKRFHRCLFYMCFEHRYLIYRLLKLCYVPAASTKVLAFFAAATDSTNETNKAGGTCH